MKRLKVVFVRDPLTKTGMNANPCRLADADTGEEIGCVKDFAIDVPVEGAITVNARLLVSEIEVR